MTKLTPAKERALRVIAAATDEEEARYPHFLGFQGRAIAMLLWPDSEAWKRTTRSRPGFQGSRGGTMPMKGARVARELADLGLLSMTYSAHHLPQFKVSKKGRRLIAELDAKADS